MGIYENHILPHVINCACGLKAVQKQRQKVVPQAKGRVLEVGMGSGLNLPFYNPENVEFVWGLEPSEGMRKKAQANLDKAKVDVKWLDLPGEQIPLDDDSVDTVLLTYTLCTIPDWQKALEQMRRVLKPAGELIFCEHGQAPDASIQKWQARINPWWGKIAGGCHLNRPIPALLDAGGFKIDRMDSMYIPGPRIAAFNYWGVAHQE
jgi:ubiquinone/menaquinone biosynthesis C-methylase UbiE